MMKTNMSTVPTIPALRSLDQAKEFKDKLVSELLRLQLELSSKNKTFENGQRMEYKVYQEWRLESIKKISEVSATLQHVKRWISHPNLKPEEKAKPSPTRIEALEKLYRRVKSYAEVQKEGAAVPFEELKSRWQDILQSLGDVAKAEEDTGKQK